MRLKWFVIPAVAVGLGACKKEEAPAGAKTETPAAETVPAAPDASAPKAPEAPAAPKVTAEQRSAKLGFAKHLPQNVETLISVYDAKKTAERTKTLKLWKLIEGEMGLEAEPELEEAKDAAKASDPVAGGAQPTAPGEAVPPTDPAAFTPDDLWGSEVTVALGDTSGQQLGNLFHLYRRYSYFQMRHVTKLLIAEAKGKGDTGMAAGADIYAEIAKDVVNDPEGGAAIFEKLGFPPIYVAMKTDAAKREQAAQAISSSLGMIGSLPDMVEPVEVEKAGAKFSGFKILGAKLSEQVAAGREEMEKYIEPDTLDRLLASLAKKDIVILTGTIGDYVVIFVGGSADQLAFAADEKSSLAGGSGLTFADSYLNKDLAALVYGEKESLQLLVENASTLSDTAKGIKDGLSGEDGLGDTREIESLFQVVVDREAALRKLSKISDSGTVAFYENGLKIESFGGADQGAIDWNTAPKLSSLGDSPDVVLFANGAIDPTYDKASMEFLESIFQTAYAVTRKVGQLPGDNEDLAQVKQFTELFEQKFRTDAIGIWEAFSKDFHNGLGRESALVVDCKGTVPPIPGIPQPVVDKAKFPRISVISPVTDRAKLASAWEQTNKSATSILAKVSEMSGSEIPMQKPISSEKNGLTTWFFAMPFFNDDFMPSVTVGDKWFIASTSKNQAIDLAEQAGKAAPGKKAAVFRMNFVALQAYAKDTLKVVDANADAIFGENGIEEYKTNKENIQKGIDALDDLDSLNVESTREGGLLRTSIHFKTR